MTTWFQSPAVWYTLGFAGQLVFATRFFIPWWTSERTGRVVVPRVFWVLCLLGGVVLLAYAWHKRDPVLALGQVAGVLICGRNLALARAKARV